MSTAKISIALETAINALSPALPTVWENTSYTPVVGTAYQRVDILFAQPVNNEFGRGHREQGYMQVRLFYPLLTGKSAILTRAELIRSTFYRGASFTKDGIVTRISDTPEIGSGETDGDFHTRIVKVRFFAHIN